MKLAGCELTFLVEEARVSLPASGFTLVAQRGQARPWRLHSALEDDADMHQAREAARGPGGSRGAHWCSPSHPHPPLVLSLQSLDSWGTSEDADAPSKRHSTSDLSDTAFSDIRREGWLSYKQVLTKKGKVRRAGGRDRRTQVGPCSCWRQKARQG